jgi:hypothetical protein
MFWSPNVPVGFITNGLAEIPDLQLVINGDYKKKILELQTSLAPPRTMHETHFFECCRLWRIYATNWHLQERIGPAPRNQGLPEEIEPPHSQRWRHAL